MSKYAQVLDEKAIQFEQKAKSAIEHQPQNPVPLLYRDLIQNVFPRNATDDAGKVVAFTSYSPGEGVSHVVHSLAAELATSRRRPTLSATADVFIDLVLRGETLLDGVFCECDLPNLWSLPPNHLDGRIREIFRPPRETATNGPLTGSVPQGFGILRGRFTHVLIDCQSVKNSDNIANVAEYCNGVILVVEADRTRSDQVELACNAIEAAHGTFLGCVLNKRKYPIPDWLYRHL